MRQVGTLSHENHARRFVNYLTQQGIGCKCEVSFEPLNGHMAYQIWIQDEDRIEEAGTLFSEFEKNPSSSKFDAPEPEPEPVPEKEEEIKPQVSHAFKPYFTYFIIALCSMIFLLGILQKMDLAKIVGTEKASEMLTPIQTELMYDLPPGNDAPYWKGIYGWIVAKIKGETFQEGPLFDSIRQGQVWRLFTPCILHKDLLHILFNMLWVWYLGRPIEQRIGFFRLLFFTLVVGILSNTIQYLMSGPFFIGYSGVVTGLAGFIWMRERIAPWEGYPLTKGTILFLLFFIIAIFGLQVVSFFIEVFTKYNFAPNIANAAHIAGAIIGAILARFRFFKQRIKS